MNEEEVRSIIRQEFEAYGEAMSRIYRELYNDGKIDVNAIRRTLDELEG